MTPGPRRVFSTRVLPGRADPEGTSNFFRKVAESRKDFRSELAVRIPRRLGLWVSRMGFGGYRVAGGIKSHMEALREAILQGVNVIDTAPIYRDGGSESLVGEVLRELNQARRVERNEIVVVTKAGYLQGSELAPAMIHPEKSWALSGDLRYSLDPDIIGIQLERSLKRIGLEAVDVYLLQNPEELLEARVNAGIPADEAVEASLQELEQAFDFLEQKCRQGVIRAYGVSSNLTEAIVPASVSGAKAPAGRKRQEGSAELFAGRRKLHAAVLNAAAGRPDFAALQFPANLLESDLLEALEHSHQAQEFEGLQSGSSGPGPGPGGGMEAGLEVADLNPGAAGAIADIWTMSNRPLNAQAPSGSLFRLARMAEPPPDDGASTRAEFQRILDIVKHTEDRIREIFAPYHFRFDSRHPAVSDAIIANQEGVSEVEHLRAVIPLVSEGIQATINRLFVLTQTDRERFVLENYTRQANGLISIWGRSVEAVHHERLGPLEEELNELAPELFGRNMASQAVGALLAGEYPDTVLVGMRRQTYVRSLLACFQRKAPSVANRRKAGAIASAYVVRTEQGV